MFYYVNFQTWVEKTVQSVEVEKSGKNSEVIAHIPISQVELLLIHGHTGSICICPTAHPPGLLWSKYQVPYFLYMHFSAYLLKIQWAFHDGVRSISKRAQFINKKAKFYITLFKHWFSVTFSSWSITGPWNAYHVIIKSLQYV